MVWRMAYNTGIGGGYYIAQQPCKRIAKSADNAGGGGNQRMIDSRINASK